MCMGIEPMNCSALVLLHFHNVFFPPVMERGGTKMIFRFQDFRKHTSGILSAFLSCFWAVQWSECCSLREIYGVCLSTHADYSDIKKE